MQRNAMGVLGKRHQALPKELVESFGHDPAAVTGVTRRLKGWRAVEDIFQRLVKQRHVFAAFMTIESHRITDHGSILDDKVSSLVRSLSILEERKEKLAERSREVESVLQDVQKVYKEVKMDYDKTMPLTSTLYPEVRPFSNTTVACPQRRCFTAVPSRCPGGKLQGSVSANLGVWNGRSYTPAGHSDTFLENLRQNHRRRYTRLPHHPFISQ